MTLGVLLDRLRADHRDVLWLAETLDHADEAAAGALRGELLNSIDELSWEHFVLEETVVLPVLADRDLAERIRADHAALRAAADRIRDGGDLIALRGLADDLRRHVELEERDVYPRLAPSAA